MASVITGAGTAEAYAFVSGPGQVTAQVLRGGDWNYAFMRGVAPWQRAEVTWDGETFVEGLVTRVDQGDWTVQIEVSG